MLRIFFVALVVAHGLIHLLGVAKAFGLAPLPQLSQAISRPWGVVWLLAGGLLLTTATMSAVGARSWWVVGAVAVALSQVVLCSSWSDAKFGTPINLVVLLAVIAGGAHHGPWGLPAEYERALGLAVPARPTVLAESELLALPGVVRAYVRKAGVVGQPRVQSLRATWTGRIRSGPEAPWMSFGQPIHQLLDGSFGAKTEEATEAFQVSVGIPVDGVVEARTNAAAVQLGFIPRTSARPRSALPQAQVTSALTVAAVDALRRLGPSAVFYTEEMLNADGQHIIARLEPHKHTSGTQLRFWHRGITLYL